MKICPFCKEQIQDEAVKCRFCGEWLQTTEAPPGNIQDLKVGFESVVGAPELSAPNGQKASGLGPVEQAKIQRKCRRNIIYFLAALSLLAMSFSFTYWASKRFYNGPAGNMVFPENGIYGKLGELIGRAVLIGIITWLIKTFFRAKMKFQTWLVLFSLTVFGYSAFISVGMLSRDQKAKSLLTTFVDLGDKVVRGESVGAPVAASPESPTLKLEVVMRQYIAALQELQGNFNSTLENMGIMSVLTPERLMNKSDIMESLDKLALLKDIQHKYVADILSTQEVWYKKMMETDEDKDFLSSFSGGFLRKKAESVTSMNEWLRIEDLLVVEMSNLLRFFLSRQGGYQFDNGVASFYKDEDVNAFNGYMASINRLSEQETRLLQDFNSKYQSQLDLMRSLK